MVLSDTAIDLAGTFPSNVLIVYAWTRMLRMRSPALFFVVLLALSAVVVLGRNGVGSIARLAFVVIGFGVVPFAFSSDSPLRKALVIALMNAMIVVAEAVSIAAWYAVVGLDITDYDVVRSHMGAFVCTHILHLLVLTALFSGFHAALGRFDRTGAVDMRGFVWFPVIQAVLLGAALASGVYVHRGSEVLFFGMTALSAVCLATDRALFSAMRRHARKRREDQRAVFLRRRLDRYLELSLPFVAEVERTARFRHDVRNHVQTILVLSERGERVRAQEHLAALRACLDEPSSLASPPFSHRG